MKRILIPAIVLSACGLALAKLPPPDEATKAKAAETAARTAWQGKVDGYLLCKAQDRVAAAYMKTAGKPAAAKDAKPTPAVAVPVAASPAASAAAPAAAATPPVAGASGTPVAAATALPPGPCSDPGPFAYTPAEQKPLEAAGAHSPAGTAISPPSTKQPSAEIAPAKKS